MSAVTKPMIHTVSARQNPSQMVNIETVVDVAVIDRPGGRPGDPVTDFVISFIYKDAKTGGNQTIEWVYDTAAARNTDYTQLIAARSTAI